MEKSYEAFREKLETEHKWPTVYMFKFIVPKEKENEMLQLFPKEEWKWQTRISKNGSFTSYTAKKLINDTDEVIEVYKSAHSIEGIIAL